MGMADNILNENDVPDDVEINCQEASEVLKKLGSYSGTLKTISTKLKNDRKNNYESKEAVQAMNDLERIFPSIAKDVEELQGYLDELESYLG